MPRSVGGSLHRSTLHDDVRLKPSCDLRAGQVLLKPQTHPERRPKEPQAEDIEGARLLLLICLSQCLLGWQAREQFYLCFHERDSASPFSEQGLIVDPSWCTKF